MNIGVLGANGFIGSSFCVRLLEEGHRVWAFYNQNQSSIPKGCHISSINNLPHVELDCLMIAIGGHGLSYYQYLQDYLILDSLLKRLNFNKIIFISSVEVYGTHHQKIHVNSCFNQPNIYGMSKLSQEFLVRSYENSMIVRPTYVYGSGMRSNSLIPAWINMAQHKNEITVFGEGKRKQDYLYIEDLTHLCISALYKNQRGVFIAATGTSITNLDLAKQISEHLGGVVIKFKGDDISTSFEYDITETTEALGWKPKISIEEGMKKWLHQ